MTHPNIRPAAPEYLAQRDTAIEARRVVDLAGPYLLTRHAWSLMAAGFASAQRSLGKAK